MKHVLLEMDRILRPTGYVIVRESSTFADAVSAIAKGMRWNCRQENTEIDRDQKILICQKKLWHSSNHGWRWQSWSQILLVVIKERFWLRIFIHFQEIEERELSSKPLSAATIDSFYKASQDWIKVQNFNWSVDSQIIRFSWIVGDKSFIDSIYLFFVMHHRCASSTAPFCQILVLPFL